MTLNIEIVPEHHHTSKVYTTGSTVAGHVNILSEHALSPSEISIYLIGTAQKRLELSQLSNEKASEWQFLKLRMPVDEADLSSLEPEGDQRYKVPFRFIIPHRLTLGTCKHDCTNVSLHRSHLRLPPTMGFWEVDDMSPDLTTIAYYIRVKVHTHISGSRGGSGVIEEQFRIKILPAAPSEPPMELVVSDEQFCPQKSLSMRNGRIGPMLGILDIHLGQPKPLVLSADGQKLSTTSATLALGFATTSEAINPPNIKSITGQIISHTFYGSEMLDRWPHLGRRFPNFATPIHDYVVCSDVIVGSPSKIPWQQGVLPSVGEDNTEHQGLYESKSVLRDPILQAYQIKHQAYLGLPLALASDQRRKFLPTFHSCHFSRTYTLRLKISTNLSIKCFKLEVPLQIGVETFAQDNVMITGQTFDGYELDSYSSRDSLSTFESSLYPPCYEDSG